MKKIRKDKLIYFLASFAISMGFLSYGIIQMLSENTIDVSIGFISLLFGIFAFFYSINSIGED